MNVSVYVLTTSEGLIPDVDVLENEADFLKQVRGWLSGKELYIEDDEHKTPAVDSEGRLLPALMEKAWDVPPFAWDQSKYELRWYKTNIEVPPARLRSAVHQAVEEYDPEEHGYTCPGGLAGCPCGAVKVPDNEDGTYSVPTHDEFAVLVTNALLERSDATDVTVDVSQWMGYGDLYRGEDDTWVDPIYVTAEDDDEEEEFHDAVCDLGDPTVPVREKVAQIVTDLING